MLVCFPFSFSKLNKTFDCRDLIFILEISHIYSVEKLCVGKWNNLHGILADGVYVGHKYDTEVFGHQRGNGIFIGTFTDNIHRHPVFFIEAVGKSTQS